jgi:probable F420-dependent oxidoreductase
MGAGGRVHPTLTLGLANFAAEMPDDGWLRLFQLAETADQCGVDRIVVVDHVVMGSDTSAYDGGRFPTAAHGPWLEPLTTLGVLAGRTQQVRLSTGILIAGLRRPAVLAKSLATLDQLSGGRVDLGVGVGWQAKEYEAAGLPFEARGRLLDETLAVLKALWGPSPASYESAGLQFDDVWCEPKPLQPGGVPLWVSGRLNRRTLERIVRFGDGWIPWSEYAANVVEAIPQVHAALRAVGRDPEGFEVRGTLKVKGSEEDGYNIDGGLAEVDAMVEAGVTDFQIGVRLPAETFVACELVEEITARFRRKFGRAEL